MASGRAHRLGGTAIEAATIAQMAASSLPRPVALVGRVTDFARLAVFGSSQSVHWPTWFMPVSCTSPGPGAARLSGAPPGDREHDDPPGHDRLWLTSVSTGRSARMSHESRGKADCLPSGLVTMPKVPVVRQMSQAVVVSVATPGEVRNDANDPHAVGLVDHPREVEPPMEAAHRTR
jgi:hypothetical protein